LYKSKSKSKIKFISHDVDKYITQINVSRGNLMDYKFLWYIINVYLMTFIQVVEHWSNIQGIMYNFQLNKDLD
jgi:hypothetical protein